MRKKDLAFIPECADAITLDCDEAPRDNAIDRVSVSQRSSKGGDAVGGPKSRRAIPAWTGLAERLAAVAVLPALDVVEARLVAVKVRVVVVRPIAGKSEDRSDDRRRDGSAAEDQPPAFTIGVIDRNAGIRIGIGRCIGFRTVGTAGVQVALEARLCVDMTASAPGARPRGLFAGLVGRQRRSADGGHRWKNGGPLRGCFITVVSGRRGNRDTADVEVVVVRPRAFVAAPAISCLLYTSRCV